MIRYLHHDRQQKLQEVFSKLIALFSTDSFAIHCNQGKREREGEREREREREREGGGGSAYHALSIWYDEIEESNWRPHTSNATIW